MINQLGLRVASELAVMGVSLVPKQFEIWFMHLNGEEPELTSKIERFVEGGGQVSDDFLDQLIAEFLIDSHGIKSYSQNLSHLNNSSQSLETISAEIWLTLAEIGDNAKATIDELDTPELDRKTLLRIVENSIEKSRETVSRMELLEGALVRASGEIAILRRSLDEAQQAAITDELTGLFNRRHFMQLFDDALAVGLPPEKWSDESVSLGFE